MTRYTRSSSRKRQSALGKRKTEYRERTTSPTEPDEIDLTDEVWVDELLPIVPDKPPERYTGQHTKEEPREEISIEKLLKESMVQAPKPKREVTPPDPIDMETKEYKPEQPLQQKQQQNSLQNFPDDPRQKAGNTPLYIIVLEVICGCSEALAFITTAIAWYVQIMRTGG